MIGFSEYSTAVRSLVVICFFILVILQSDITIARFRKKEYDKAICDILFLFSEFSILVYLTVMHDRLPNTDSLYAKPDPPFVPLLSFSIIMLIYTIAVIVNEYRMSRHRLSSNSIKEAFDNLPTGLCIFSDTGLPVLCNHTFYRLIDKISGQDLQHIDDVHRLFTETRRHPGINYNKEENSFTLSDRKTWAFSETVLNMEHGRRFTQISAKDISALHRISDELSAKNIRVTKMAEQLKYIEENIAGITREEEILSAKMQVHNKLGSCMLLSSRYYMRDCPKEDKANLISAWEDAIASLREEIDGSDDNNTIEELIRIGKDMGVTIVINGTPPSDSRAAHLFLAALRESLTNLIIHAKGTRLTADITYDAETVLIKITDNGTPPRSTITEGGGLTSLRCKIEDAGGSMTVLSLPQYILTLNIPSGNKNIGGIST